MPKTKIEKASEIIKGGGLVAFPTETVYGLGGDATNDKAVARIFELKGRPQFNPLITHVPSAKEAFEIGFFPPLASEIASHFWPGPLSLIVRRSDNCPISWLASAGLETIAIRVPDHPIAQNLLKMTGCPVAAPSANISGRISPTRPEHVVEEFGSQLTMVLDGGDCKVGLESTVLDLSGRQPTLLRPGKITRANLETIIGPIRQPNSHSIISSPGMLASHYAPKCNLRLNAMSALEGEAFLGFGDISQGSFPNLSTDGDLVVAASNLFHMLRELDRTEPSSIAVAPIPNDNLGVAINDRLRRAAAPKEISSPVVSSD